MALQGARPPNLTAQQWLEARYFIIRDLLARGADPNYPASAGRSPLALAIDADDARVVTSLLDYHADPNGDEYPRGPRKMSPIIILAVMERDTRIVKALLDRGADPNAVEYGSDSALGFAIRVADPACVSLLVAHHASLSFRDAKGLTPVQLLKRRQGITRPVYNALLASLRQPRQ
jgi:ankyrin repeat protein